MSWWNGTPAPTPASERLTMPAIPRAPRVPTFDAPPVEPVEPVEPIWYDLAEATDFALASAGYPIRTLDEYASVFEGVPTANVAELLDARCALIMAAHRLGWVP